MPLLIRLPALACLVAPWQPVRRHTFVFARADFTISEAPRPFALPSAGRHEARLLEPATAHMFYADAASSV